MQRNGTNPDAVSLIWMKTRAVLRTAIVAVLTLGKAYLILAIVVTALASILFHLNALVAFIGALIGCAILCVSFTQLRSLCKSEFAVICQEEHLWELADRQVFEEAGVCLQDILEDRQPKDVRPDSDMWLSQAQLIFIRKGQLQKALKIAEYLSKDTNSNDNSAEYSTNALACLYVEIGRYEDGIGIFHTNLSRLESDNRSGSPAYVTTLVGLIQASIDKQQTSDAERFLKRLKQTIESTNKEERSDDLDQAVKRTSGKDEVDMAFYWLLSGRLKTQTGDSDAESALIAAKAIMANEQYQKTYTLLYPEILLALASLALKQKNFEKAEELAKQSLEFYEKRTRYTGAKYLIAKATLVYSRLNQGTKENATRELETILQGLRSELAETHPDIATCLAQLAASHLSDGNRKAGRAALEEALLISTKLFPQDACEIHELRNLLER